MDSTSSTSPLLDIAGLCVAFGPQAHPFHAVDGIDLRVDAGEVLGIVGESGSGKSVTSLALTGLLGDSARVSATRMRFNGVDLLNLPPRKRRALNGGEIGMIFQEPMRSLNPSFTIGWQIAEALRIHEGGSGRNRRLRATELLARVGIADPVRRFDAYPHEISGGMSQRAMVAMAIACNPKLLIADEPTTALDVTIQAQIVALLLELQRERGMALILITHDLALVAEAAQRIAVMYAGQIVETAPADALFATPRHPYTEALLAALPRHGNVTQRLQALGGVVPGQFDRPDGCLLSPRCPYATPRCAAEAPTLDGDDARKVRCFYPLHRERTP